MVDSQFDAKWIPKKVKTMIIGGELDIVNPVSLFSEDKRFDRPNISQTVITGAGHWCWVEKPEVVKKLFDNFIEEL